MPTTLLGDLEQAGLPLLQVKEAMASIGYGKHALHELDRWGVETNHGEVRPVTGYCESPSLSHGAGRCR